jgi:hypothetical protein
MERKTAEPPHETRRRGRLKNGNQSGDFSKAARCGAKTRRGTWCQCPAMKNGRCRLHGGLSTGPKTAEGIERIRRAVTKHGNYTKRAMTERAEYRELLRACREMLADLSCNGTVPFGYHTAADGLHLEADPAEQGILSRIRELKAAGNTTRQIADELYRQGFTTRRGTAWRFQYVAEALRAA